MVNLIIMSIVAIYSSYAFPPSILHLLFLRWFAMRKLEWVGYQLKHQALFLMTPKRQVQGGGREAMGEVRSPPVKCREPYKFLAY